jgi:hypothetical protein
MSRIQSGHFVQITPISGLFQSNIHSIVSIFHQPSLITITLQNVNDSSDVKTLLINSVGYIIQGETQQYQLTFKTNLSELQGERASRQIGTGQQQFAMTGVGPIDINILLQMDDQTLTSACQTDRYISGLCRSEELWRLKIGKDYYGAGEYKNKDRTWREYYKILQGTNINTVGANNAAERGHLDVLRWMESLTPKILPDIEGVNEAAYSGHLDVLKWLTLLQPPILPTVNSANEAAANGHLNVLRWMARLTPKILPDKDGVNDAAEGHLDVLKWMESLTPKILPDEDAANYAAGGGYLDVLQWMAKLRPPILPNKFGADVAAANGHLDVLIWMARLTPEILPDEYGADRAARKGHLDVLKWMESLTPKIRPATNGINGATRNGHLDILVWMASLQPPILRN